MHPSPAKITIESFADARARLDVGQERAAVLASLALDEAAWRAEEESLLSALADDADAAETARLTAYERAYQDTWRRLVGTDFSAPAQERPAAPVPTPVASTSAEQRPVETASYRRIEETRARDGAIGPYESPRARPPFAAPPGPSTPIGAAFGAETAAIDSSQLRAALPFANDSPPALPAKSTRAAPSNPVGTGTEAISHEEILRAITPFGDRVREAASTDPTSPSAGSVAVRAPAPLPAPPPPTAIPPASEARTAGISAEDILRAVTPFQPAPASAPVPSRPVDPRIDTGTSDARRSTGSSPH